MRWARISGVRGSNCTLIWYFDLTAKLRWNFLACQFSVSSVPLEIIRTPWSPNGAYNIQFGVEMITVMGELGVDDYASPSLLSSGIDLCFLFKQVHFST